MDSSTQHSLEIEEPSLDIKRRRFNIGRSPEVVIDMEDIAALWDSTLEQTLSHKFGKLVPEEDEQTLSRNFGELVPEEEQTHFINGLIRIYNDYPGFLIQSNWISEIFDRPRGETFEELICQLSDGELTGPLSSEEFREWIYQLSVADSVNGTVINKPKFEGLKNSGVPQFLDMRTLIIEDRSGLGLCSLTARLISDREGTRGLVTIDGIIKDEEDVARQASVHFVIADKRTKYPITVLIENGEEIEGVFIENICANAEKRFGQISVRIENLLAQNPSIAAEIDTLTKHKKMRDEENGISRDPNYYNLRKIALALALLLRDRGSTLSQETNLSMLQTNNILSLFRMPRGEVERELLNRGLGLIQKKLNELYEKERNARLLGSVLL